MLLRTMIESDPDKSTLLSYHDSILISLALLCCTDVVIFLPPSFLLYTMSSVTSTQCMNHHHICIIQLDFSLSLPPSYVSFLLFFSNGNHHPSIQLSIESLHLLDRDRPKVGITQQHISRRGSFPPFSFPAGFVFFMCLFLCLYRYSVPVCSCMFVAVFVSLPQNVPQRHCYVVSLGRLLPWYGVSPPGLRSIAHRRHPCDSYIRSAMVSWMFSLVILSSIPPLISVASASSFEPKQRQQEQQEQQCRGGRRRRRSAQEGSVPVHTSSKWTASGLRVRIVVSCGDLLLSKRRWSLDCLSHTAILCVLVFFDRSTEPRRGGKNEREK